MILINLKQVIIKQRSVDEVHNFGRVYLCPVETNTIGSTGQYTLIYIQVQ